MNNRTSKKRNKYPGKYKLHQYLKYAHQWASKVAYKGVLYEILEDGRIKRIENMDNCNCTDKMDVWLQTVTTESFF